MRLIVFNLISILLCACCLAAEPYENLQWGLSNSGAAQNIELDHITTFKVQARAGEDIKVPSAQVDRAEKIIIAVLDTGVDTNHPDLKGRIHRNESECKALEKFLICIDEKATEKDSAGSEIGKEQSRKLCEKIWMDLSNPEVDLDKNGYPLDCSGWSILGPVNEAHIRGRPDFSDGQGHGTHVAGIIAANRKNGIGVAGVSNNIEILPVQVLGLKPQEPIKPLSREFAADFSPFEMGKEKFTKSLGDMVARGVIYAVRSGAKVINFSMGWPESADSEYLRKTIEEAQKLGVLIVAAAGNDSTRALLRPCAYPGVICVAAHGPDGALSHFSNYGSGVDLAAPGTNILSTNPTSIRPVRFRAEFGYEFMHGTSQAAPMVAGVIGEMLAQGIPSSEIYARLILSARPLQEKLPLLSGAPHELKEDPRKDSEKLEPHWILSGMANLQGALTVPLTALILPTSKERQEVVWDRQQAQIQLKFAFKNLTKDIASSEISLQASFLKVNPTATRPAIKSVRWDNQSTIWKFGEVRNLLVDLQLIDAALKTATSPLAGSVSSQSRIPSELDLIVDLTTGANTMRLVLESEIVVPIQSLQGTAEMQTLNLIGMPALRTSLVSIDENFDGQNRVDYLAINQEKETNSYFLLKHENESYKNVGAFKVKLGADQDNTRELITARMDHQGTGSSGYVLGLLVDRSENDKKDVYSSLKFYFLNSQMQLEKSFDLENRKVQMPLKVFWQQITGVKRPAWVGKGYDPYKKISVRDKWENPTGYERPQSRFYYLDRDGTLQALEKHLEYQIIDVIEPSASQVKSGRVPVLLAKDRGTELKPSYIYDFAIAEVFEGKVEKFRKLDFSENQQRDQGRDPLRDQGRGQRTYQNLLDTRVDQAHSLDYSSFMSRGTFWFGDGPMRSQRISILIPDFINDDFKMYDETLFPERGLVDSTLKIRAAFYGQQEWGAFALTNSEIQYHDMRSHEVAVHSLERYTFYPDMVFTAVHFPVTLGDSLNPGRKIPALYITEESGFNRGVKFKAAVRDQNGKLTEIVSPARLRLKSGAGCRPLANPVFADDGTTALDYYCGNKILRTKLMY